MASFATKIREKGQSPSQTTLRRPREAISGVTVAGPLAQVQAYLAVGAAITGAIGALLPHPAYFNVAGLLGVQAVALGYGLFVLAFRKRISYAFCGWATSSLPS